MPELDDVVREISRQGWLQGDIVLGEALATHIPDAVVANQLDGSLPTHWVLISHSCTVHARNYADATNVEWIACKLVKKKPFGKYLNALNPRQLQIELGAKLFLDLKLQRRVWTSRSVLPALERSPDGVRLEQDQRDTLSYWLAHGYTRVAMPDKLVERLKKYNDDKTPFGLGVVVDGFLERNAQYLDSAWVSFFPKIELDVDATPYEISFRFLVKRKFARELQALQADLADALAAEPGRDQGIILGEADVTPLQDFTMLDAQDYIRYNVHDWLSLGDEGEDG
ncbi:hypothetical protein [Pseudomonas lundensis]|uniref:hypothetical protein n=1 Tax=Pseudomonas lundensis TaxID=86185 RepID=UPI0014767703|nr:hypothetical protein [Pseudomonas lundensis]NNA18823.1 hypothetical protein [Pseudomonas lundensis]